MNVHSRCGEELPTRLVERLFASQTPVSHIAIVVWYPCAVTCQSMCLNPMRHTTVTAVIRVQCRAAPFCVPVFLRRW